MLAIFRRTGVAGISAVEIARALLSEYASLGALLNADWAQFCAMKGLGNAKYVQLKAVLAIALRVASWRAKRAPVMH